LGDRGIKGLGEKKKGGPLGGRKRGEVQHERERGRIGWFTLKTETTKGGGRKQKCFRKNGGERGWAERPGWTKKQRWGLPGRRKISPRGGKKEKGRKKFRGGFLLYGKKRTGERAPRPGTGGFRTKVRGAKQRGGEGP